MREVSAGAGSAWIVLIVFTTQEHLELSLPIVVKKNSRRETFDSNKIRQGLIRACQKRPVSLSDIDSTVLDIEQQVAALGVKDFPVPKLVPSSLKL